MNNFNIIHISVNKTAKDRTKIFRNYYNQLLYVAKEIISKQTIKMKIHLIWLKKVNRFTK